MREQVWQLVEADARPKKGGKIECRHSHPPFEATTTENEIVGTLMGCPITQLIQLFSAFKGGPKFFWHSPLDSANGLLKSPAGSAGLR
jgi:hypothetical protein